MRHPSVILQQQDAAMSQCLSPFTAGPSGMHGSSDEPANPPNRHVANGGKLKAMEETDSEECREDGGEDDVATNDAATKRDEALCRFATASGHSVHSVLYFQDGADNEETTALGSGSAQAPFVVKLSRPRKASSPEIRKVQHRQRLVSPSNRACSWGVRNS